MGAVETWMIDCAYTEVGKSLKMPTHAYLGMTDSKVVDAQCGLESSGGAIMAALAGVNMISGAGMMDFESCQSFEKLVIDAEIIGMAKRLKEGIKPRGDVLALELIRKHRHNADYLNDPHTLKWFNEELFLPSPVIDRRTYDSWVNAEGKTIIERASKRVEDLIKKYKPTSMNEKLKIELRNITEKSAQKFGMQNLPEIGKKTEG